MKGRFKADILALDTASTPISAHFSQLHCLADQYGEEQVLQSIVPGTLSKPSSDGCRWFQYLTDETRRRLAYDLRAWKTVLRQKFQRDRGAIMLEADSLQHSFASESAMTLQVSSTFVDRGVVTIATM